MSDYLVMKNGMIYRRSDSAWIPPDPRNADYTEFVAWLGGNTPDYEGGSP